MVPWTVRENKQCKHSVSVDWRWTVVSRRYRHKPVQSMLTLAHELHHASEKKRMRRHVELHETCQQRLLIDTGGTYYYYDCYGECAIKHQTIDQNN